MYNWLPKLLEVDPEWPNAAATCMRCGFLTNIDKMSWQFDYRGGPNLVNTRILTCSRPSCMDVPQPQLSPIILSPDPEPVFNARPYPYVLAETSWLSTEDGDIIDTQSGLDFITAIPNPSSNANTAYLEAVVDADGQSFSVLYLDLFNGNPATSGVSVLSLITGSHTRTDIAGDLSIVAATHTDVDSAVNTDVIEVADECASTVNVNYIAFYSAASGGTLLMSAPLAVRDTGTGLVSGRAVVFNQLGLTILNVPGGTDMVTELGELMITEAGADMVLE